MPALQPLPEPQPGEAAPSVPPPALPVCKSGELLRGGRLYIEHRGEVYCLRLTKSGKLLLTK